MQSGTSYSGSCVAVSADGQDWTLVTNAYGDSMGSVDFVHDRFIASAYWEEHDDGSGGEGRQNAKFAWSFDGLSWEYEEAPYFAATAIAYDDGVFVAASGDRILRSTDGITWEKTRGTSHRQDYVGATHGPAGFIAVGISNDEIIISDDGKSWETVYSTH